MANLWDDKPGGPSQAELNPLMNPLLERNLGRWARVYFSHPPGKREQAVSKLLDEIKREIARDQAAELPSLESFLQPESGRHSRD